MNARARSWWLLPCVLSACAAESDTRQDAAPPEAGLIDRAMTEDDAGFMPPPQPTYAPTFTAVFNEVFEQRFCTSVFCHGIGGATLNFSSKQAAYASLVDHEATGAMCRDQGLVIVVPGEPDASLLLAKVSSDTPPCGGRMPRIPGVFVEPREIEQIRAWILRGAPND